MLEMLIYSKENNKELERNIFAGLEIIGHNILYKDEELNQILKKWNVENEYNKNAIVFSLLSPWYARNIKEVENEINKISELFNYQYNEDYINYVKIIYHLIHNDEKVKLDNHINLNKELTPIEELININILDAINKNLDMNQLKKTLSQINKKHNEYQLIIKAMEQRLYLFNQSTKINNMTKFIANEFIYQRKCPSTEKYYDTKFIDWYFNDNIEILKKNLIYNLLGDLIENFDFYEMKDNLFLEDYDQFIKDVEFFCMEDSDYYKVIVEIKNDLPLIFSKNEDDFIIGLDSINQKLKKYNFKEKFIFFNSVDDALKYLNKEYLDDSINYNEIFEKRYFMN